MPDTLLFEYAQSYTDLNVSADLRNAGLGLSAAASIYDQRKSGVSNQIKNAAPFAAEFAKNKPEIRTYFINGKFVYSIITSETVLAQPCQEGGTYKKFSDEEYAHILKLAKHTMQSLPKLDLKGKHTHPILTRIDVGSGIEDPNVPFGMFVNEVEFVPSLYIENHSYPVIQEIAKSFVDVAKEYKHDHQKNERINVIF
jgi:hypothetical protein